MNKHEKELFAANTYARILEKWVASLESALSTGRSRGEWGQQHEMEGAANIITPSKGKRSELLPATLMTAALVTPPSPPRSQHQQSSAIDIEVNRLREENELLREHYRICVREFSELQAERDRMVINEGRLVTLNQKMASDLHQLREEVAIATAEARQSGSSAPQCHRHLLQIREGSDDDRHKRVFGAKLRNVATNTTSDAYLCCASCGKLVYGHGGTSLSHNGDGNSGNGGFGASDQATSSCSNNIRRSGNTSARRGGQQIRRSREIAVQCNLLPTIKSRYELTEAEKQYKKLVMAFVEAGVEAEEAAAEREKVRAFLKSKQNLLFAGGGRGPATTARGTRGVSPCPNLSVTHRSTSSPRSRSPVASPRGTEMVEAKAGGASQTRNANTTHVLTATINRSEGTTPNLTCAQKEEADSHHYEVNNIDNNDDYGYDYQRRRRSQEEGERACGASSSSEMPQRLGITTTTASSSAAFYPRISSTQQAPLLSARARSRSRSRGRGGLPSSSLFWSSSHKISWAPSATESRRHADAIADLLSSSF